MHTIVGALACMQIAFVDRYYFFMLSVLGYCFFKVYLFVYSVHRRGLNISFLTDKLLLLFRSENYENSVLAEENL